MYSVLWIFLLLIGSGCQNDLAWAKYTYCAWYEGSDTREGTRVSGFKYSEDTSTSDTNYGKVSADNRTIQCPEYHDHCYTAWYGEADNKTKIKVVKQGCWNYPDDNRPCQDECQSVRAPPKTNKQSGGSPPTYYKFCCCSGSMCNANFTDIYDADLHTTDNPPNPGYPYLPDPSYREKTIIISLVSVSSVAIFVIGIYFLYRICLGSQKPSMDSLNLVEAPPVPGFEIDDLKICNLLSKGRYSEVWKGLLYEQEVAVKVYVSHHRQYYQNEKYIYSLPFMEHDNLLKFYGVDERLSQDGMMQYMLVMSYAPLGCLMGYLKTNTIDWATLCKMCYSLARGLSHLHTDARKGDLFKPAVAHRDLNSRNILVGPDLNCIIADLGFCMTAMGSKLIRNGYSENAEQSSLTDVGTLRYMAPELLDGAVNLRDCESSLKQIDIYGYGLVMWEVATRCHDLYQGAPVPAFTLPYQAEAGLHPTFEELQILVSRNKTRPKFSEVWKDSNQAIRALRDTMEDCWDHDAEARLTALCVEERVLEMMTLWAQDSRHKGVTPTINPGTGALMSQGGSTDRTGQGQNQWTGQGQGHQLSTSGSSPYVPHGSSSLALIVNDTQGSCADIPMYSRQSWMMDRSVSASTTDTILPMSPSEPYEAQPKSLNVNTKNNAVLQPHQGRNPTVERNTHKRSDEELTVSGNRLIYNNCQFQDSESSHGAPPLADQMFETIADNLETSLVQNDVLSQHRNPPIPYLQNQVHVDNVPVRPKMANVPGNGSTVPYNKMTVNEAKSQKQFFGKFKKPKDLGSRLSQLGLFGKNSISRSNQSIENKKKNDRSGHHRSSSDGTTVGDQPASGRSGPEPTTIHTEVRLQNGATVVRPANFNININSKGSPEGANANTRSLDRVDYPENRLGVAEVGVAKLELAHHGHPSVLKTHGNGFSKSTSDLSPEKKGRSLKWKETDLMDAKYYVRPSSLSLKGHNYKVNLKLPSSNSLTVLVPRQPVKVNNTELATDSGEKIKRRVKTPVSMKCGRFSLYDDRLMTQGVEDMCKYGGPKKSSISLQQFKCVDGDTSTTVPLSTANVC